jgi:ADP-L-glycero-D-manno-heptose 6-epimerase
MIIVTGNRGFIASELIAYLESQGKTVHGLDWDDRGKTYTLSEPVEWVFHLGAVSGTNAKNWNELVQKNIQDTQQWIRFAEKLGCGITYASSGSVYGPWNGSPEWGPLQPQHLYGVSKLAIDNWCAEQDFSVPVQGMRFFNVYGRNETHKDQPSPICRYIKSAVAERKLTVWHHHGRVGSRDFISVDDCIDAMMRLKDSGVRGVYNIGTGYQQTFEDVARCVQKHLGINEYKIYVVPMPDDMVPTYQWESLADLTKLKSVLPTWNPQSVDQWLDKNFEDVYNKIQKELQK